MKRGALVYLLFAAVAMILSGCEPNIAYDYREGAFFADISCERNGIIFSAEVEAGAEYEADGVTTRDVKMLFTSPPSLSGILVSRENNKICLLYGDIAASFEGAEEMLRAVDIIVSEGELKVFGKANADFSGVRRAVIEGADGVVELTVDENGYPRSVKDGAFKVSVSRFEPRSKKTEET